MEIDSSTIVSAVVGVIVTVGGWLVKRSITALYVTLKDIRETVHGNANGETGLKSRVMILEERSSEQGQELMSVSESLEEIGKTLQDKAVKDAENFGEVKADIREILTALTAIKERRSPQ